MVMRGAKITKRQHGIPPTAVPRGRPDLQPALVQMAQQEESI